MNRIGYATGTPEMDDWLDRNGLDGRRIPVEHFEVVPATTWRQQNLNHLVAAYRELLLEGDGRSLRHDDGRLVVSPRWTRRPVDSHPPTWASLPRRDSADERAHVAHQRGYDVLAEVIDTQEGRRIVRERWHQLESAATNARHLRHHLNAGDVYCACPVYRGSRA